MKILVVDDDKALLEAIVRYLEMVIPFVEIESVSTLMDALEKIRSVSRPYDWVVTDFRIPKDREGLTVAKVAKGRSQETSVISMSSDMTDTDKAQMQNWASYVLVKPFKMALLATLIKRHQQKAETEIFVRAEK